MGGPANTGGSFMGMPGPVGGMPNSMRGSGTALDPQYNDRWGLFNRGGSTQGFTRSANPTPIPVTVKRRTINGVPVVPPAVAAPPGQPAPATTPVTTAPEPPTTTVDAPAAAIATPPATSTSARRKTAGTSATVGGLPYTATTSGLTGGRGGDRMPKVKPAPVATPAPVGQPAPVTPATPPYVPVTSSPPVLGAIPAAVGSILGGLYGRGATASNMGAGDPRGRAARRIG